MGPQDQRSTAVAVGGLVVVLACNGAGTMPDETPGNPVTESSAATTEAVSEGADADTSSGDAAGGTTTGAGPGTTDAESAESSGASTGDPGDAFDPDDVTSCADIGLPGFCIDAYDGEDLFATKETCPFQEVCRVVVHPGIHVSEATIFTYHHWYRHYIGVLDEDGQRPVVMSNGTSVFANKGSLDRQQNIILQNLELAGPSMGVDFDGAVGEPYQHHGGLSWLDNVKIAVESREILFNGAPDGLGAGSIWCTRCEIVHEQTQLNPNSMIAITQIDLAWFSDTTLSASNWSTYTAGIDARSVGLDGIVDQDGAPIVCGDYDIECRDGPTPELLRDPTLASFEALVYAQDP